MWKFWKKKTSSSSKVHDDALAKLKDTLEMVDADATITMFNADVRIRRLRARIAELEHELGLKDDEVREAWGRWQNSTNIATSYGGERVKIIQNLDRFGMTLDKDNEIVVHGPRMIPAVVRNGEMIKPAQMIPILAKGLQQPPPPPYSGDVVPIICWYRLVPDDKIKGQINEEFSHYEDCEMTLQDPKNRKNKKMIIKLPTANVPTPRGGTKFSGKWVWHQKFRTEEVSPRIVEDQNAIIKEKAAARFKELRAKTQVAISNGVEEPSGPMNGKL